jgi:predicted Zn-dependent peptidase
MEATLGMLGFWLLEVSSIVFAYMLLQYLLSGHMFPLDMLAEVLNDRTGRLYRGLVEGRGIASSARSASDTRKYAWLFSFEAETRGVAEPLALDQAWYEELKKIQEEEIPERELRKVKNRVAAGNYRRLENNMSLLVQLAFAEALLDWREINDGPKKYEAVTAADIQRVAKKYFAPTNRSVAVFKRQAEK